jgi:hypothetical protein
LCSYIEVIAPNPKVVTPNLRANAPNLGVVVPNPKVTPTLKAKGMEEEVEGKPSHTLENIVACDNWHVHRHGRVYVFSMPLFHRKHKKIVKKFNYITNKNLFFLLPHLWEKKRIFFVNLFAIPMYACYLRYKSS